MSLIMKNDTNKDLKTIESLVSIIRDLDAKHIDLVARFINIEKDYVLYIHDFINEHYDLEDKKIAEMLIAF